MLEIMIVIAVAGMVMAISVPFVQRTLRRDAVYTAVKVVDEACRNARALAIFGNRPTEVVIHPQDKSFSVQPSSSFHAPPALPPLRDAADPMSGDPSEVRAPRAPGTHGLKPFSGTLAEEVTIELLDVNFREYRDAEETRVVFHPNGTADEFTIVLRIGTSAWRKLTLDIVTGIPSLEIIR